MRARIVRFLLCFILLTDRQGECIKLQFFFVHCDFLRIKTAQIYDDYRDVQTEVDTEDIDRSIPLQTQRIRRENVLEAQIQEGDTLQAIALRYNCTVIAHISAFPIMHSIRSPSPSRFRYPTSNESTRSKKKSKSTRGRH